MTTLSPAAEAVFTAILNLKDNVNPRHRIAATALRAAADQVAPEDYDPPRGVLYPEKEAFVDGKCVRNEDIRSALLAIATELENTND